MPSPGTVTTTSPGSKQGIYRPTLRLYFHNTDYGITFADIEKPVRCRSRDRAIELAKQWKRTDECKQLIAERFQQILQDPRNSIK